MVAAARLHWLAEQVSLGRSARVAFSVNDKTFREKVKFVLAPRDAPRVLCCRSTLMCALAAVREMIPHMVVTDKGHMHSDGSCTVEFWLALPSDGGAPPGGAEVGRSPAADVETVELHEAGTGDVEPPPKRSRTSTEVSFASICDEAGDGMSSHDLAVSATEHFCGTAGVAAAQAPDSGAEPTSGRLHMTAGNLSSNICDEASDGIDLHCEAGPSTEHVSGTGSVAAALGPVSGAAPTSGRAHMEASFLSSASPEVRVNIARAVCLKASKAFRGKFHHLFRSALRFGSEAGLVLDAEYRNEYIRSFATSTIEQGVFPDGIPQEVEELVEQFVISDLRFLHSDLPAAIAAPAPGAAPAQSDAGSGPSSAAGRISAPTDGGRPSGLRATPGFGKGPKRTKAKQGR